VRDESILRDDNGDSERRATSEELEAYKATGKFDKKSSRTDVDHEQDNTLYFVLENTSSGEQAQPGKQKHVPGRQHPLQNIRSVEVAYDAAEDVFRVVRKPGTLRGLGSYYGDGFDLTRL